MAQKKKKKPAQRIDSSDDEMEEATAEGLKVTKQPCFGAQYMLFRVCARRESRLVVAKTAAAAAHGQCGQMWHFDCQRYYSPLRACSGHTFTTCIPPSCWCISRVQNKNTKTLSVKQPFAPVKRSLGHRKTHMTC